MLNKSRYWKNKMSRIFVGSAIINPIKQIVNQMPPSSSRWRTIFIINLKFLFILGVIRGHSRSFQESEPQVGSLISHEVMVGVNWYPGRSNKVIRGHRIWSLILFCELTWELQKYYWSWKWICTWWNIQDARFAEQRSLEVISGHFRSFWNW